MRSLSIWRRAWYSLSRRPRRALLLTLIMAVVFTALISQSGVRAQVAGISGAINSGVNAGFTAYSNSGNVSLAQAEKLNHLPQVKRSAFEKETLAKPEGARLVATTSGVQLDAEFAGDAGIIGTTNSQLHPSFMGRLYRLESGKHLAGGTRGALIHREFAQRNGLHVGSQLSLNANGNAVTVPVVGIFSGKTENPGGLPAGASENQIFTDLANSQRLGGKELTTARYFTGDANSLPAALRAAKQVDSQLSFESNAAQFAGVLATLSGVNKLLTALAVGVSAAGLAALALIMIFWIRGRTREIGVLLAVGKTKANILGQLALESAFLALVGSVIGATLGYLLSGKVSSLVFAKSASPSLSALSASGSAGSILAALVLGYVITFTALLLATVPLLRQTPRAILAKIS
ncbi:FtsX-like permease family protein [Varibaculum cambriense]|uniref:ABC transporter permease n=1 Tax=uncultured Varibaculum sp. TaxID=413896 RepID=UPI000C7B4528|nr:FtsX-like permease family protein [uncultured Varibaculum sp.]WIK88596.1 FtsX-like permease family protein [Varibaculum cambriense]